MPVSPETPVRRVETIGELAEPALFLTTDETCRIRAASDAHRRMRCAGGGA
ncbi:hypothetical protein [Streptomyces sp. TRM68367]|uniref:hypothetical protein n=1 Tax=Streptomyces sp. TRM68367 TaxID=2758415 RepID=UPI00165B77C7|nr:hypothetical protein [Streptomyces sp. TRM68367]MBC9731006.1 hypothetical protein [Streptomyces sp. TRM68367]